MGCLLGGLRKLERQSKSTRSRADGNSKQYYTHSFILNFWLKSAVANSPGDLVIRAPGMHKRVRFILAAAFSLLYSAAAEFTSRDSGYSPHAAKRMQGRLHLPLSRRLIPKRITLSADTGVAGLGDFFDV